MTTTTGDTSQGEDLLRSLLQRAVQEAEVGALVTTEPGCDLPVLALFSDCGMPYDGRADIDRWLAAEGIDAELRHPDDVGDRLYDVIVPHTPEAVAALASAFVATRSIARDAAAVLQQSLGACGASGAALVVDPETVVLEFKDWDELAGPVAVGVLLGAVTVADDLNLYRPRHKRKLLRRLELLLTGALGPVAAIRFEEGCTHEPDIVRLDLGIAQTTALAARLAQAGRAPAQDSPEHHPTDSPAGMRARLGASKAAAEE